MDYKYSNRNTWRWSILLLLTSVYKHKQLCWVVFGLFMYFYFPLTRACENMISE